MTQAQCVGFSKPQVLNTDQGEISTPGKTVYFSLYNVFVSDYKWSFSFPNSDFDNCQDIDNISDDQSDDLLIKVYERVKSTRDSVFKCIADMFLSYLPVTIS